MAFAGKSSVIGEFPAQMASNVENVLIWWRKHDLSGNSYALYILCALYV